MLSDTGEGKVSKVIQEALKLHDILGYEKTVQILHNLQNINKFNDQLKNSIVEYTLEYFDITFDYLKQEKKRKYDEKRINALSITSMFLKKYLKFKNDEICVILKKKGKQNINYYLDRLSSLNERNPADAEIINAINSIELRILEFINNFPL